MGATTSLFFDLHIGTGVAPVRLLCGHFRSADLGEALADEVVRCPHTPDGDPPHPLHDAQHGFGAELVEVAHNDVDGGEPPPSVGPDVL